MARNTHGDASEGKRYPFHQAPLSAVQELIGAIGAIGAMGANVARFNLGNYDVFLFAVRRANTHSGDSPKKKVVRRATGSRSVKEAPRQSNALPELDSIIAATCRRINVKRRDLVSKTKRRSRPLSLARALIAGHASKSGVANPSEVALLMNLNQNSLYVGIGRYRRFISELFEMPLEQFLDTTQDPSETLRTFLGEQWSKSYRKIPIPDSEIGERIARALPHEEIA
jgi:transposase-like protein